MKESPLMIPLVVSWIFFQALWTGYPLLSFSFDFVGVVLVILRRVLAVPDLPANCLAIIVGSSRAAMQVVFGHSPIVFRLSCSYPTPEHLDELLLRQNEESVGWYMHVIP